MKSLKVLLAATMLSATMGQALAEVPIEEQFPGSWNEDAPVDIIITLAHAQARGCGEFYYRTHVNSHPSAPQYLVYCTPDGETWTAYLVFPNIDRVVGPSLIPDTDCSAILSGE